MQYLLSKGLAEAEQHITCKAKTLSHRLWRAEAELQWV
jgi:hypothetical protein